MKKQKVKRRPFCKEIEARLNSTQKTKKDQQGAKLFSDKCIGHLNAKSKKLKKQHDTAVSLLDGVKKTLLGIFDELVKDSAYQNLVKMDVFGVMPSLIEKIAESTIPDTAKKLARAIADLNHVMDLANLAADKFKKETSNGQSGAGRLHSEHRTLEKNALALFDRLPHKTVDDIRDAVDIIANDIYKIDENDGAGLLRARNSIRKMLRRNKRI